MSSDRHAAATRRVLALAPVPRRHIVGAALAGAGASGAAVALTACSAWLISRAALQPPILTLMTLIVGVRAFGIARGALRYVERLASHDAALRWLGGVRVAVYDRLARIAPAGLYHARGGDLLQRFVGDVDALQDLWLRVVLPISASMLVCVVSVGAVTLLVPAAGLALGVAVLLAGVLAPWIGSRAAAGADARLAPARADLADLTYEVFDRAGDRLVSGDLDDDLARIAAAEDRVRGLTARSAAAAGTAGAITVLAQGLAVVWAIALGTVAVRAGELRGELLAVIVLTPLALHEVLSGMSTALQTLRRVDGSAQRVVDILDTPIPVTEPAEPVALPAAPGGVLACDDLAVAWTPGRVVVSGVTCAVAPAGDSRADAPRRIALVGPSGVGKSSVAAAMVRFVDPAAGRITYDGADTRRAEGAAVRRRIGLLGQGAHIFSTTIRENLRVAAPDAEDADLWAALDRAHLGERIRRDPAGLDLDVGHLGATLSGGEQQRLGLARLRLAGFETVILDEPTEHLDEPTAQAVMDDWLAPDAADGVVLISHRPREGLIALVDEVVAVHPTQTATAAAATDQRRD